MRKYLVGEAAAIFEQANVKFSEFTKDMDPDYDGSGSDRSLPDGDEGPEDELSERALKKKKALEAYSDELSDQILSADISEA